MIFQLYRMDQAFTPITSKSVFQTVQWQSFWWWAPRLTVLVRRLRVLWYWPTVLFCWLDFFFIPIKYHSLETCLQTSHYRKMALSNCLMTSTALEWPWIVRVWIWRDHILEVNHIIQKKNASVCLPCVCTCVLMGGDTSLKLDHANNGMKCLLSLFYFIFFVSHAATNIYLYYHIVHMCQKLIWWCKRNHYLRRHSINHIAISSWRTANNDKIKHIGIDQYFDRWCFPSIDIMFLNYVIMVMNNMLLSFCILVTVSSLFV